MARHSLSHTVPTETKARDLPPDAVIGADLDELDPDERAIEELETVMTADGPRVVPQSTLPLGVEVHATGAPPIPRNFVEGVEQRDPKAPPANWKGGYARCGGCGDFLGSSNVCRSCCPTDPQSNVQNVAPISMHLGPKVMA